MCSRFCWQFLVYLVYFSLYCFYSIALSLTRSDISAGNSLCLSLHHCLICVFAFFLMSAVLLK